MQCRTVTLGPAYEDEVLAVLFAVAASLFVRVGTWGQEGCSLSLVAGNEPPRRALW